MREKRKTVLPVSQPITSTETVISADTVFKGNIDATKPLRVEGQVDGDICSKNTVYIGESGLVNGTIHAQGIIIGGKIKGKIDIIGTTEIDATGILDGDMKTKSIIMAEGATFNGNCEMIKPEKKQLLSGEEDSNLAKAKQLKQILSDDLEEETERTPNNMKPIKDTTEIDAEILDAFPMK